LTLRYRDGDRDAAAHIFTAALGWSNTIFAYAYANETAESWLDGHQGCVEQDAQSRTTLAH
jgi:hypothetical protein